MGIHRAVHSTADGRLIRQYTPAASYGCITHHAPHSSSPFLKPAEAP
jgi:hypothetical protein